MRHRKHLFAAGRLSWLEPSIESLEARDLLAGDGAATIVDVSSEPVLVGARDTALPIVELADIDGDGDLDFLTAPQDLSLPFVWFENVDGLGGVGAASREITTLPVTDFESADVDRDGDLDVVVAAWADIYWFENIDGAGNEWTRRLIVEPSIDTYTYYDFVLGDINEDGYLDIVYDDFNGVRAYVQDGEDGTFELSAEVFFEREPKDTGRRESVTLGDIDNDGHLDVVYARHIISQSYIGWFRNVDGTGLFEKERRVTDLGWNTETLVVNDIDGDGRNDILSGLYLYRNLGVSKDPGEIDSAAYRFERTKLAFEYVLPVTHEISVDMDLDGDLDVLAASGWNSDSFAVAWFENNGRIDGSWPRHLLQLTGARSMDIGDINNDGQLDVVVSDFDVHWWPSAGGMVGETIEAIGPGLPRPQSIASGDIDGDGDRDLLVASSVRTLTTFLPEHETVMAWFENVDGEYESPRFMTREIVARPTEAIPEGEAGETGHRQVWLLDIDNDGDLDAVWFDSSLRTLSWHANDGLGDFGPAIVVIEDVRIQELVMADLNGDLRADLLLTTPAGTEVRFGNEDNLFAAPQKLAQPIEFSEGETAHQLSVQDIDADGDLDIAAAFRSEFFESDLPPEVGPTDPPQFSMVMGYFNDGVGGFGLLHPLLYLTGDELGHFAMGDLDGDDDLDLVAEVTDPQRSIIRYENRGELTFTPLSTIGSVGSRELVDLRLVDMNGDRHLDVVYADRRGVNWFPNCNTVMGPKQTLIDVGDIAAPSALQLFDVDADDDVDLLTLLDRSHEIALYQTTITAVRDPLPGDVNGDGTVDSKDYLIISRNFMAMDVSRSEGDLNGDGRVDVRDFILVSLHFGRSAPVR